MHVYRTGTNLEQYTYYGIHLRFWSILPYNRICVLDSQEHTPPPQSMDCECMVLKKIYRHNLRGMGGWGKNVGWEKQNITTEPSSNILFPLSFKEIAGCSEIYFAFHFFKLIHPFYHLMGRRYGQGECPVTHNL